MADASLDYSLTVKNDNSDEMELSMDNRGITLRYPQFETCPSQTIILSFEEFDQVSELVNNYRKMREIAQC